MPTYDYLCSNGHRFEVFQRMSDEPIADCQECGESAERQISGGAGFLFKGDGFYITDYRSDDYKKKASAEVPSAGSGDGDAKSGAGKAKDSGGDASSGGAARESGGATSGGSPGSSAASDA